MLNNLLGYKALTDLLKVEDVGIFRLYSRHVWDQVEVRRAQTVPVYKVHRKMYRNRKEKINKPIYMYISYIFISNI